MASAKESKSLGWLDQWINNLATESSDGDNGVTPALKRSKRFPAQAVSGQSRLLQKRTELKQHLERKHTAGSIANHHVITRGPEHITVPNQPGDIMVIPKEEPKDSFCNNKVRTQGPEHISMPNQPCGIMVTPKEESNDSFDNNQVITQGQKHITIPNEPGGIAFIPKAETKGDLSPEIIESEREFETVSFMSKSQDSGGTGISVYDKRQTTNPPKTIRVVAASNTLYGKGSVEKTAASVKVSSKGFLIIGGKNSGIKVSENTKIVLQPPAQGWKRQSPMAPVAVPQIKDISKKKLQQAADSSNPSPAAKTQKQLNNISTPSNNLQCDASVKHSHAIISASNYVPHNPSATTDLTPGTIKSETLDTCMHKQVDFATTDNAVGTIGASGTPVSFLTNPQRLPVPQSAPWVDISSTALENTFSPSKANNLNSFDVSDANSETEDNANSVAASVTNSNNIPLVVTKIVEKQSATVKSRRKRECKSIPSFSTVKFGSPLKTTSIMNALKSYLKQQKNDLRENKWTHVMYVEQTKDDTLLYCEECKKEHRGDCPVHGPLVVVQNMKVEENDPDRALHSLPINLLVKESNIDGAGLGVFTDTEILPGTTYGPYEGTEITDPALANSSRYCWQIYKDGTPSHFVDAKDTSGSNWMRYVNCATSASDQNLAVFQYHGEIYYRCIKPIFPKKELLVWYGDNCARMLGIAKDKNVRHKQDDESHMVIIRDYNLYKSEVRKEPVRELSAYKRHFEVHSKETPYRCEVCDKAFSLRLNLKRHMKMHIGDKPFNCQICNKAFTQKSNLNMHMKLHTVERSDLNPFPLISTF